MAAILITAVVVAVVVKMMVVAVLVMTMLVPRGRPKKMLAARRPLLSAGRLDMLASKLPLTRDDN